ncbi:hypothetical protein CALCODRAFT_480499 [Calocera cornea HHB12733]|uniref:Uncharacterized protein n=1 Tax=Calocera cornea HHB12733 TaxID=1353952 RepID=A0A165IHR6_9BASI|nr:hypothetical protein CALCODRAFT_480499 [Calocera cornea HHB12733]
MLDAAACTSFEIITFLTKMKHPHLDPLSPARQVVLELSAQSHTHLPLGLPAIQRLLVFLAFPWIPKFLFPTCPPGSLLSALRQTITCSTMAPEMLTAVSKQLADRAANLNRLESTKRHFKKIPKVPSLAKGKARAIPLDIDVRFRIIIRIWGAVSTTRKQENLVYRVAQDQFIANCRRYGLITELSVPRSMSMDDLAAMLQPALAPFHFPPPAPPDRHALSNHPNLLWLPARARGGGSRLMPISIETDPPRTAGDIWSECGGKNPADCANLHLVPRNGHLGKLVGGKLTPAPFRLLREMTRDTVTIQDLDSSDGSASDPELPSVEDVIIDLTRPVQHHSLPLAPPCRDGPTHPVQALALHTAPPPGDRHHPPPVPPSSGVPSNRNAPPLPSFTSHSPVLQVLDDVFHDIQGAPDGRLPPLHTGVPRLRRHLPVAPHVRSLQSSDYLQSPEHVITHLRASAGIEYWGPSPTVAGDDTPAAARALEEWLRRAIRPIVLPESTPVHQVAQLKQVLSLRQFITVGRHSRGRGTSMDVLSCLEQQLVMRGVLVPVGMEDFVTLRVRDFSSSAPLAPLTIQAKLDCAFAGAVCLAFLCLLEQGPPGLSPLFLECVLQGGSVSMRTVARFEPQVRKAISQWDTLGTKGVLLPPSQSLERHHPQYPLAHYFYEVLHLEHHYLHYPLSPDMHAKWRAYLIDQATLPLPWDHLEPEELHYFRLGLNLTLQEGTSLTAVLANRYAGGPAAFVRACWDVERLTHPDQLLARLDWTFDDSGSSVLQNSLRSTVEHFLRGSGLPSQLNQALDNGRFAWSADTRPGNADDPLFRARRFLRTTTGSDRLPKPGVMEGKIWGVKFSTCSHLVVLPLLSRPGHPGQIGDYRTGLNLETFLFTEITANRKHTTV